MKNNKKIAVFHSFMDNIGGAEMVALILARELGADIYTTTIDPEKIAKMGFGDLIPRIKSLGTIPKMAPFRHQLALWKFRRLNLGSRYDFYIIAGDWAVSAAVNHQPNLWYVHSPLNELWEFKAFIKNTMLSWWKKPVYELWVWYNRKLTKKYAKQVGSWVCNSRNTQARIKKYYGAEATVVNPPVETAQHHYQPAQGFWLSVNRLVAHKRVELQLAAFARLPQEKLIIVGSYERGVRQFEEYRSHLESIQPANVEVINWVPATKLLWLYDHCLCLIATARDEDFGMTVVEAMASGKPVIAANEGGYRETVLHNQTGLLLEKLDPEALAAAVKKVSQNPEQYKEACLKQAARFDVKEFIRKIKEFLPPEVGQPDDNTVPSAGYHE